MVGKTKYWHITNKGKVQCDLCPRFCRLGEGQRGLCYVRGCKNNEIVLFTYGRSSGFCIDPVEKKPLYHFYPGSPVLSFGTAGCNLACKFCQNWDISKSKHDDTLSENAAPEKIVKSAQSKGCKSIAYTYNDPIVFMEYAQDVAYFANKVGIKNIAVTSGFINEKPRKDFFSFMDAANIDLKAFTESFYKKFTGGSLAPVLDTLKYLKKETKVWFEITTLLIPGENDSNREIEIMSKWIYEHLGPNVPLHFTAFHPTWKMQNYSNTPASTLLNARKIALKNGLNYVYTGNIRDEKGGTTFCHSCKTKLITRDGFDLTSWDLNPQDECNKCGAPCPGHFDNGTENWGNKRERLNF